MDRERAVTALVARATHRQRDVRYVGLYEIHHGARFEQAIEIHNDALDEIRAWFVREATALNMAGG